MPANKPLAAMRLHTMSTSPALLLGLALLQVLGSAPIDRAWQTAIAPVTLNLRNKLAEAPYTVTFIVTTKGQEAEWSYTTESEPNAWQRPQFPKDFEGPRVDHQQAQTYTWHARVRGDEDKHVIGGSFTYPNRGVSQKTSPHAPEKEGQDISKFKGRFTALTKGETLGQAKDSGRPASTCNSRQFL